MRILINRTDAIGDTILTLPMASMLKQAYPKAKIAFMISKNSVDLFTEHKYVEKCYVVKRDNFFSTLNQFIRIISEFKPDHYIYVGGSHIGSFAAFLKRVKFRGGLVSRLPSFFFLNKGIRQKRSYLEMHEAEYNLNLLKPLGLAYDYHDFSKYDPGVFLAPREIDKAKEQFAIQLKNEKKEFSWDQNIIFIHPGMKGHTLNWPSRNYGRLITYLNNQMPDQNFYIISYTPSDERYISVVRDELEESFRTTNLFKSVYFFDGSKKGLRFYMNILSQASVFVGPSTGTTHLANTLGVETIGIYSPIKVQSALRWKPFYSEKVKIVTPDVICGEASKCVLHECPYYECMSKIEAKEVAVLIINMIVKLKKKLEGQS